MCTFRFESIKFTLRRTQHFSVWVTGELVARKGNEMLSRWVVTVISFGVVLTKVTKMCKLLGVLFSALLLVRHKPLDITVLLYYTDYGVKWWYHCPVHAMKVIFYLHTNCEWGGQIFCYTACSVMVFLSNARILYILSQKPAIYIPSIYRLSELTNPFDP
jgi:hypothetical protein